MANTLFRTAIAQRANRSKNELLEEYYTLVKESKSTGVITPINRTCANICTYILRKKFGINLPNLTKANLYL
jgi:hypothetical protein